MGNRTSCRPIPSLIILVIQTPASRSSDFVMLVAGTVTDRIIIILIIIITITLITTTIIITITIIIIIIIIIIYFWLSKKELQLALHPQTTS